MSTNAAVLKNKGAQVLLFAVEPEVRTKKKVEVIEGEPQVKTVKEIAWVPQLDAEGETISVAEWVRFDNGSLATLQNFYGSMEAFQEISEQKPNEAVAVALGVMLGVDPFDVEAMKELNARIDPDQFVFYQVVVMAMLSIANGVDPTKAALMIEEGRLGVAEQMEAVNAEIEKALTEQVEERKKREQEKAEAAAAAETESAPTQPPSEPATDSPQTPSTTGTDGSDSGSESVEPTPSSGS